MTGNNVLYEHHVGRVCDWTAGRYLLSASNASSFGVQGICPDFTCTDRQVASSHASADVTAQEFVLYLVRFLLFQESAGMNDLRVTLQHNSGTTHLNA